MDYFILLEAQVRYQYDFSTFNELYVLSSAIELSHHIGETPISLPITLVVGSLPWDPFDQQLE